jgi:hypothetical protein
LWPFDRLALRKPEGGGAQPCAYDWRPLGYRPNSCGTRCSRPDRIDLKAGLDIIRGPWFKKVRLRTNTMGRVSIQSGRGVIQNSLGRCVAQICEPDRVLLARVQCDPRGIRGLNIEQPTGNFEGTRSGAGSARGRLAAACGVGGAGERRRGPAVRQRSPAV